MVEEIILSCEYSHNSGTAYFDNISVVYDPEGTSQYIYDENGRTKVSITGNDVIYYSYNTSGKLKDKITRKSRVLYDYTSTGNLKSEKYYTYSGQLLYLADYAPLILALGNHTLEMESSYQYNDYGLLTQSKVKSPREDEEFITQTTYNVDAGSRIFGSIKTTIDSLSETVMYFYDEANGRLLANIQPDGNGTCYSYDAMGNLTMVQPSVYSSNEWSAISNSVSVEYSYNSLNQLESISANGTEYNFTYDVFGNKTSVAVGGTSIVSQTYNPGNGKINSVTYSNGTVISYLYDKLDRVEKLVYNNNGVETVYEYEYDSNGNLNKYTDVTLGTSTLYKYDSSGRMTRFIEYDTDAMKNLSSAWYVYDDHSRISSIFYSQDYQYNSQYYCDLSYYLSYWYNADDSVREYKVKSYDDTTYLIIPTYDGHNRVSAKEISLDSGTDSVTNNITYSYKTNGTNGSTLVTQYTSKINTYTQLTYNFTYDNANANITEIRDESGDILYRYM